MHSMTGYGRGEAAFANGKVIVEIKSVNHRFLEVRPKAPKELLAAEAITEKLLRERLSRGYCTVNVLVEGGLGGATRVDAGAVDAHLDELAAIANRRGLELWQLVSVLAGASDVFVPAAPLDTGAIISAIERAAGEATSALIEMRQREGKAMADELGVLLRDVQTLAVRLETLAESWPQIALERLRGRLLALFESLDAKIDPARLEAEVAVLVDRADVSEELTRIKSHSLQLTALQNVEGPIGRKLEFVIQELGREANTLSAKAAMAEMTTLVIDLKTNLEKMRELAQNVE